MPKLDFLTLRIVRPITFTCVVLLTSLFAVLTIIEFVRLPHELGLPILSFGLSAALMSPITGFIGVGRRAYACYTRPTHRYNEPAIQTVPILRKVANLVSRYDDIATQIFVNTVVTLLITALLGVVAEAWILVSVGILLTSLVGMQYIVRYPQQSHE